MFSKTLGLFSKALSQCVFFQPERGCHSSLKGKVIHLAILFFFAKKNKISITCLELNKKLYIWKYLRNGGRSFLGFLWFSGDSGAPLGSNIYFRFSKTDSKMTKNRNPIEI